MTPPEVILPIILPLYVDVAGSHVESSVNHMFPSGPATMPAAPLSPAGSVYSVSAPAGVILPIAPPSVNQTFPSGPDAITIGKFVVGNDVATPVGVILHTDLV